MLRKYGIECEYADEHHVILIPTPMNTQEELNHLKHVLLHILTPARSSPPKADLPIPYPKKILTPREAMLADTEKIPLTLANGRIAADAMCPCPPGIPIVMPGERIDSLSIEFLEKYSISSIKVLK